uniref:Uncharacterized protein n=1 Tax=Chenopodium quinoa TaxID=63459 RepID=A0A803MHU4_CHEQI
MENSRDDRSARVALEGKNIKSHLWIDPRGDIPPAPYTMSNEEKERPRRNEDGVPDDENYLFNSGGRVVGKKENVRLDDRSLKQAHCYVLLHSDEVTPVLDEFITLKRQGNEVGGSQANESIENQWIINEFPDWLLSQVNNLNDSTVEEKLRKALARGLSNRVRRTKSLFINGYKFGITDREKFRTTQNSGIMVEAEGQQYYGKLKDIFELDNYGFCKVVMFRCDWNEKWGPFGPPKTTTSAQSPSINPESIWKKPPTTPTPSLIMEAAKDKQGCSQKTTPKLTAIVSPNMPPNMPPIAHEPFRHPSTSSPATHQPFRHPSTSSPATHQPFRHPSTSSPAIHQQCDLHQPSKQGLQNQASNAAKSSNAAPQNKNQTQQNIGEASKEVPKKSKSLRCKLLPDWREDIEFDDKEEVLTIDDKGNTTLVSGVIHPVDVLSAKGFKYVVEFNDLCKPIRKGGHVLIKFIGYLAKMESHCPLGPTDWKKIDGTIKGNVVTNMRDHFVISDGKEYDKQALQRANKAWRQYKFELKKLYFKPKEKTMGEKKTQPPAGISPLNWTALLDYWYSDKAQEDEHGEPMSLLALWIKSHSGKDGSFLLGTDTEDFVDDVKAKVEHAT